MPIRSSRNHLVDTPSESGQLAGDVAVERLSCIFELRLSLSLRRLSLSDRDPSLTCVELQVSVLDLPRALGMKRVVVLRLG